MVVIEKLLNSRFLCICTVFNHVTKHRMKTNIFDFVRFISSKHVLGTEAISSLNHHDSETTPSSSEDLSLFPIRNRKKDVPDKNYYVGIENNEKLFKGICKSMINRKYRERMQQFMLEGVELVEMALKAGVKIEKLFYSHDDILKPFGKYQPVINNRNIYKIRDRSMRDLTGDLFSPKLIALCNKLSFEAHQTNLDNTIPVTVLCSDIRDPENMGSILALAAASGCKKVLLSKGCVDVWDRKVLYYGNGAHFYLPILNNIMWSDIKQYFPENAALYIADCSTDIDITDAQLFIENGDEHEPYTAISDKEHCDESAPNVPVSSYNEEETSLKVFENLPCKLYTEVTFPKKEIVVYVGGETVGVNDNIEELTSQLGAEKIKLPLENHMESLNVSAALSVILYEIKRQFTFK